MPIMPKRKGKAHRSIWLDDEAEEDLQTVRAHVQKIGEGKTRSAAVRWALSVAVAQLKERGRKRKEQ